MPGSMPPSQLSPFVFVLFPLTVLVGVVVANVQIPPSEGVGAVLSSQGCPNSWVVLGVQAQHRLLVFLGWVWEGGSHRCQLGRQGFHSCPRRWGDHLDVDIDVACQVCSATSWRTKCIPTYRIAENFLQKKTFANWWIFAEKTFVDCSLMPLKDAMPPNFTEKTFATSHKTSKSTKVFSLESSQLYSSLIPRPSHRLVLIPSVSKTRRWEWGCFNLDRWAWWLTTR